MVPCGDPVTRAVAELLVLRKHRRFALILGVGRSLARLVTGREEAHEEAGVLPAFRRVL